MNKKSVEIGLVMNTKISAELSEEITYDNFSSCRNINLILEISPKVDVGFETKTKIIGVNTEDMRRLAKMFTELADKMESL